MLKKLKKYFFPAAVVFTLLMGFVVRLYKIDSPIADWHSWRQVDTASVSRIYVDEGIDLLNPRYYDISRIQTGTINLKGLRLVEFPIFNVLHTLLFQNATFCPESLPCFDIAGRLISVFSALVSAIYIYLIGKKFMGKFGGLLSMFFFLFIPYNIYFTRVILPEPLAVAFAMASLYHFIRYLDNEKTLVLIFSGLLFAASTLVKPFTFFYAPAFFYLATTKYGLKGVLTNIRLWLFANLAINPFFLWRIWINRNPIGIPHFEWAFNGDDIRFKPAFWYWLFGERLGKLVLGAWGLIPFSMGLTNLTKKLKVFHYMMFGVIAYLFIFATASVRHDYYQIFLIPPICFLLASGVTTVVKGKIEQKLLVAFSILMMFFVGAFQVKEFYKINHPEIIEAGEAIDKLIPKDAWVIAPYNGDTAFLYQTKRFGWPVVDESIEEMIAKGADYFVAVNFGDPDVANFGAKFKTVARTSQYIILDLNEKI